MTWVVLGSALWLGVLTAISPCPLGTNIAAISFIGRQVGHRRGVLEAGLLYTAGRVLAYVVLGMLVMAGLMASGDLSRFLQKYLNEILGPVLIVLGMVLLGMIGSGASLNLAGGKLQARAAKGGVLFSLPLGVLFALSFCPVSAGLYFGALIPLSLKHGSRVLLPLVYGGGTALPVIVFAFIIAFASECLGKAFNRLSQVEIWIRRAAGLLFIVAGLYYCLTHIYGLSPGG
ncbi:MAG: aromatic aminobenezylarsenical efflux permease ArsG family transporter [Lentisphaeria bacterium]|nr:aromatic aminobenezylarsenical efflux permease ArsG family transporter [Lentisphaeria bacterium]